MSDDKGRIVIRADLTPKGVTIRQVHQFLWVFSDCCDFNVYYTETEWKCSNCGKEPTHQPSQPRAMRAYYGVEGSDPWVTLEEWLNSWTGLTPDQYEVEIS